MHLQYKLSKGTEVVRTDIKVGDDTLPFFNVLIWQKEMASMVVSGSIVLLQNVRIIKFHEIVEARTVQCSSLHCLVHPEELKTSIGVDDIIGSSRAGVQTKEKLRKVIEWVYQAGSSIHNAASHRYQHIINWKVHKERVSQDFVSLSQVLHLAHSCKATFLASVGELFLPLNSGLIKKSEERMFVSRRLCLTGDEKLADDLICNGCQLCGSPLHSQSGLATEQSTLTLYCQNNSKYLHKIGPIYRPFMLYIWDDSDCIPLLVKNKAAEIIFGNLKAETVHSCYRSQKHGSTPNTNKGHKKDHRNSKALAHTTASDRGIFVSQVVEENLGLNENKSFDDPNFYLIWLILLKILVQQGRNSPLRFKVEVNVDKDNESGRFELVSLSMPCFETMR